MPKKPMRYAVYWDGGGKHLSRVETNSPRMAKTVYERHETQRAWIVKRTIVKHRGKKKR